MRSLAVLLLLASCDVAPETPICDANRWANLVGQPETALYGALPNLRVIHPGAPVTKDWNPNRLNALIDENGVILRFGCY